LDSKIWNLIQLENWRKTWIELASHIRLYNFFRRSGATEAEVESFIAKVSTGNIAPEKTIELVNQLYEISKEESIPIQEVPNYIDNGSVYILPMP
jgi:hypothetical protein